MNIFILSEIPEQAARWLCDKHCIKMVTESFQCLSCAVIRHGATSDMMPLTKSGTPARGGYHRHPCSIWAGDSKSNYLWLFNHAKEMCKEYTSRYGKTHFCEKGINQLGNMINFIPDGNLTPFAIAISQDKNCRKVNDFDSLSAVEKYRLYYKMDKPFATWKQNKPEWY
jgi:hypothetical protein